MRLGPLLFLLWFVVLALSCAAVIVHLVRHGRRRLGAALLCPVGALLLFGFVSTWMGLAERAWSVQSPAAWLAFLVGCTGVVFLFLGLRAVMRVPLKPGQCPGCGYLFSGLTLCPECGRREK